MSYCLTSHSGFAGYQVQDLEAALPTTQCEVEVRRTQEYGLPRAGSLEDRTEISCFPRGELPHWSGIKLRRSSRMSGVQASPSSQGVIARGRTSVENGE